MWSRKDRADYVILLHRETEEEIVRFPMGNMQAAAQGAERHPSE